MIKSFRPKYMLLGKKYKRWKCFVTYQWTVFKESYSSLWVHFVIPLNKWQSNKNKLITLSQNTSLRQPFYPLTIKNSWKNKILQIQPTINNFFKIRMTKQRKSFPKSHFLIFWRFTKIKIRWVSKIFQLNSKHSNKS